MTKLSQKAIAAAFASRQLEFDSVEGSPPGGAKFVTRVADAPLRVMGRLGLDGRWRISAFLVPTAAEREDDTEAAVAELAERKILVLRDEPVAEAMIRFSIPPVLTGNFTPSVEALVVFKQRLAASRFAVAVH
jgi:hypothetical protein